MYKKTADSDTASEILLSENDLLFAIYLRQKKVITSVLSHKQEAGQAASEDRGVRERPEAGVGGPGGWGAYRMDASWTTCEF